MHAHARRLPGAILGVVLAASWLATPAGAQSAFRVKNVNPTGSSNPTNLIAISGGLVEPDALFFTADDGVHGVELWKSNGTAAGTVLVKDIDGAPASSSPANLTRVWGAFLGPDRLFFTADDGVNGVELWTSDGTPGGTVLVKDIHPTGSSNPSHLTAVSTGAFGGSRLFFAADDGTSGVELWTSDGTDAGTVRVKNINPGAASSSPSQLAAVGTTLYFAAMDASGNELWKSDGTAPGTLQVQDIHTGASSSNPRWLTNLDGLLVFAAYTDSAGEELWTSNGTPGGVVLLKNIRAGLSLGSSPQHLVNLGGTLVFQADNGVDGLELWRSDGSNLGTVMVADINPTGAAFVPNLQAGIVVDANGTLFFRADDGTHGVELWQSDGTLPGTALVKDVFPGPTAGNVAFLAAHGSVAYFHADDPLYGAELWRSDGRPAGTFVVEDISPGASDAAVASATVLGPYVFFSAYSGGDNELWATALLFKDGVELGP